MKSREDFWIPWFICWGLTIAVFAGCCALAYYLCENPECNHRFLLVKITGQIFIITTVISYIICHIVDYKSFNKINDESVKIKFSHFKDAYYVNPNRWRLYKGRLSYQYDGPKKYTFYYVGFSYLDWLKFILWKNVDEYYEHRKLKMAKQEEHDVRMAEMLKCIQLDINDAYDKIKER